MTSPLRAAKKVSKNKLSGPRSKKYLKSKLTMSIIHKRAREAAMRKNFWTVLRESKDLEVSPEGAIGNEERESGGDSTCPVKVLSGYMVPTSARTVVRRMNVFEN